MVKCVCCFIFKFVGIFVVRLFAFVFRVFWVIVGIFRIGWGGAVRDFNRVFCFWLL